MSLKLRDGEREWLASVVADLADDSRKLVYADWLEEQGDPRGEFLRSFVKASQSMNAADFPSSDGLPEEWVDLVGYQLLRLIATENLPSLKPKAIPLARPALRMITMPAAEESLPVGASKIGGLPDLPPDYAWPPGDHCRAIYNDETTGVEELAGFLAQVNCAEIAETLAGKDLPATGVLSFFCYQDIEDDNPDVIGVMAVLFPDAALLVRTSPPAELTEGNLTMPSQRLEFQETLDLPADWGGPWSDELQPDPESGEDYSPVLEKWSSLNFNNLLGYARPTSGEDPTRSRDDRHLIFLENQVDCGLHIQIPQKDLAARNFDKIELRFVDFD